MDSSVWRSSLWSFVLAPPTTRPIGTPRPSHSTLLLLPFFPLSVGLGPVFFPSQRRLALGPVYGQPSPVDAFQRLVHQQPLAPELPKHSSRQPLPETSVGRGRSTYPRGLQRSPLHARAQHQQDCIH